MTSRLPFTVVGLASAGQILCSEAVAASARGRLHAASSLEFLGTVRLKGLIGVERVFGVVSPGLEDHFPPLRGQHVVVGDLPRHRQALVGRQTELEELTSAIVAQRLTTVTGGGGVGKSALAAAVASSVVADFADGVWWVDLTAVAAGGDVGDAVASVLGIRRPPEAEALLSVAAALSDQRLLLVLDNCEHVVRSSHNLVDALVQRCQFVAIVATSRRALGVADERRVHLRPLRTDGDSPPALELLLELVGTDARVRLDPADVDACLDICRAMDGVPLSLGLAAARCRALGPTAVALRLAERLGAVDSPTQNGPQHDRATPLGAVRWSFDLLTRPRQDVFKRMSCFAASFTLDAAEVVAADQDRSPSDVEDAVVDLIEQSLVEYEHGRYRLLESAREFGRRELTIAGQRDEVRGRHLAWCHQFVTDAAKGLAGASEADWVQRLALAWPDVRAAFDHAMAIGDDTAVADLVTMLAVEGGFRRPEALSMALRAQGGCAGATSGERRDLLSAAAFASSIVGDRETTIALAQQALQGEQHQELSESLARMALAGALMWTTRSGLQEALDALAFAPDDPFIAVRMGMMRAGVLQMLGRLEGAAEEAAIMRGLAAQLGNPTARAQADFVSSFLDPAQTDSLVSSAVARAESVNNTWLVLFIESLRVGAALEGPDPVDDEVGVRAADVARQYHRHGFVAQAWTTAARAASYLQRTGQTEAGALVALGCRQSMGGTFALPMIDRLVTTLTESLGPLKMKELELHARGKDVPELLSIALTADPHWITGR